MSALVQQSLGPVTSLLQRSLDQVRHEAGVTVTTTERQRRGEVGEEEDVSDILRLLQHRAEDTGLEGGDMRLLGEDTGILAEDTKLKSKEKRLKSAGRAPHDDIFFTIPAETVSTSRPVTNKPVTNIHVTSQPVTNILVTDRKGPSTRKG